MSLHQYFSRMQSYFCPACRTKSFMAGGTLKKTTKGSGAVGAAPHGHAGPPLPSAAHPHPHPHPRPQPRPCTFHSRKVPFRLLLIKRKFLFIFKRSAEALGSSLGGSSEDFTLKLLFGESIKFFQSHLLERLWLRTLLWRKNRHTEDCGDAAALSFPIFKFCLHLKLVDVSGL